MRKYNGKDFIDKLYNLDFNGLCYNLDYLINNLEILKQDISIIKNCKLIFAVKANSNNKVLKIIGKTIDGFDCASIEEFKMVNGFKNNIISCVGPSFNTLEISQLIKENVYFDFVSFHQLYTFLTDNFEKKNNKTFHIGIRVKVPGIESRFGFSKEKIKIIKKYNILIERIHFHHSGRNLKSFIEELKKVKELIFDLENLHFLKTINIGGGFELIYSKSQSKKLMQYIENFRWEISMFINRDIEIIIEPGDLIARPIGFISASIIDIENNYITINSSIYNFSTWYNPYKMYYKGNVLDNNKDYENDCYIVSGNSCSEEDIFFYARNNVLFNINDKILLYPMGAYNFFNTFKSIHGLCSKVIYYLDGEFCYDKI